LNYSYNRDKKEIIFASARDINASFKDLCNVCDAVRYKPVPSALRTLDSVINGGMPIEFRRHNRYMGSRHELGGKKGRYPKKCAEIVRKVIVNASANAKNKGEDAEYLVIVHASANKTYEVPRAPSKGVRSVGGNYGYGSVRRSNLEYAKVEIGLAGGDAKKLGSKMKRAIKAIGKKEKPVVAPVKNAKKTTAKPKTTTPPKPLAPPTTQKPAQNPAPQPASQSKPTPTPQPAAQPTTPNSNTNTDTT